MIAQIGDELQANINSRKCPVKVIFGPEPTETTTGARERIVIEHDEEDGDTFNDPKSAQTNPARYFIAAVGVKITIYAQSAKAGSAYRDHCDRVYNVLEQVLTGLEAVLRPRRQLWARRSAKLVHPVDVAKSQVWAGAVYQLRVNIERGIYYRNFDKTAAPEATVTNIATTTNVTNNNAPPTDPPPVGETA